MRSDPIRHILVKVAVEFLPPRVRSSLLDDQEFVERWGLAVIASVTLGKDGPSFQRDQFYRSIREAIRAPGREISIEDDKTVTWRITAQEKNERLSFGLENGEKNLSISDHSGLAENHSTRMAWFEKAAHEVNLEDAVFRDWKAIIDSRPLNDDEFVELTGELNLTPVYIYRNLQTGFSRGSVDMTTLVPRERRYYDRLIGPCGSAADANSYIEAGAAPLIERLQEWKPNLGLLISLLMCSKGIVSESIRIDNLDAEELVRTYEWLANEGDPISQIGAVEVALRHIDGNRELETFIEQMVKGFITDDPDDDGGCFSLLSAMIVLVASELSRRRIFDGTRPFYRKQAAIAQAALILRAIKGSQVDPASVVDGANTGGIGHIFFLQGLIDLRVEPRWLPDFVSPYQLRAEFIGRVANAVKLCEGKIHSQSLRRLLLGKDSSLATAAQWPYPMLPGPLEGEFALNQPSIPDEVLKDVAAGFEADHLEPNSFAGIVNMALLFKMSARQADLAATALRRVRYSIENADDDNTIFGLIGGLATVAAVTRSTDLAETLRVLVRVMRRRKRFNADPDDEMRIAMVAAASHEGLEDWARFAGEWISEIAFEVVEKESAQSFLPKLRRLVQIEPALAHHCAVADAALASIGR